MPEAFSNVITIIIIIMAIGVVRFSKRMIQNGQVSGQKSAYSRDIFAFFEKQ